MKTCKKGLHQYDGKQCYECWKIAHRAWAKSNHEKMHSKDKKSRERHPEARAANSAKWRKNNPVRYGEIIKKSRIKNIVSYRLCRVRIAKRNVNSLSNGYICKLLGIKTALTPVELIEAKRTEVKLKRLLKEMKNENA